MRTPQPRCRRKRASSVVARTEDNLQGFAKVSTSFNQKGECTMWHPDGYGYNNNTGQYSYHWNGYDANGNPHSGAR